MKIGDAVSIEFKDGKIVEGNVTGVFVSVRDHETGEEVTVPEYMAIIINQPSKCHICGGPNH